jgi:hypothetical protein
MFIDFIKSKFEAAAQEAAIKVKEFKWSFFTSKTAIYAGGINV